MAKLRLVRGPADAKGRKPVKGYYAEFYDKDRRPSQKRISLATKDQQSARSALAKLERAHAEGEFDPWAGSKSIGAVTGRNATVAAAAEEYVASRTGELAASSLQTDKYVLGRFERALPPGVLVAHVHRDHVEGFLASVANDATRKSYRERVRGFLRWAKETGLRRGDDPVPPPGRGRRERKTQLPKFFAEKELSAVLDHLASDGSPAALAMRDAVVFTAGTGLRRGELCALRWDAVDLADRVVRVAHTEDASPKSGRERVVPLVGDALEVVTRRAAEPGRASVPFVFPGRGGEKLAGDYLGKRFAKYRKRAGVRDGLTFHGLRHTFGSYAVMRGADVFRLKEVLGHADVKATMVYAKLRPVSLRPDMEMCFGGGLLAADAGAGAEALRRENVALREEIARLQSVAED